MTAVSPSVLALIALVALYILLIGDWFHRAWAALGLAGALVLSGVVSLQTAIEAIDWNTMGLLAGMMIMVGILGEAGLFTALGTWARQRAGGSPWRLMWIFFILSASISAVLDNVTTVLLLSPALIRAAEDLDLDPVPFLMVEVVASNLGGLATLIGDPPNILIGTAANLTFMTFVYHLAPIALILVLGVSVFLPRIVVFRPRPAVNLSSRSDDDQTPDPKANAHSQRLPGLLVLLGFMLAAFVTQHVLRVNAATIALSGAGVALLYDRPNVKRLRQMVDWGTLGFFLGIFVLVGSMESTGIIHQVAAVMAQSSRGKYLPMEIFLGAVFFSAFLDNVPFVAAMIPILEQILSKTPTYGIELWIALALGAAVGGNGTVIGASANVVVQGLALDYGYSLTFRRFASFGLKVALLTTVLGAGYLWIMTT